MIRSSGLGACRHETVTLPAGIGIATTAVQAAKSLTPPSLFPSHALGRLWSLVSASAA